MIQGIIAPLTPATSSAPNNRASYEYCTFKRKLREKSDNKIIQKMCQVTGSVTLVLAGFNICNIISYQWLVPGPSIFDGT